MRSAATWAFGPSLAPFVVHRVVLYSQLFVLTFPMNTLMIELFWVSNMGMNTF